MYCEKHHPDPELSTQALFSKHVKAMVAHFEKSGNPFNLDSQNWVVENKIELHNYLPDCISSQHTPEKKAAMYQGY